MLSPRPGSLRCSRTYGPPATLVGAPTKTRHMRHHDTFAARRSVGPAPHTGTGTTTRGTPGRSGRACGSRVRPAATMRRFFAWEDANQDPEDEQETLELVNRFAGRVGGLTRMARQVLALVVREESTDFELVLRRFLTDRTTLLSVVRELQKAEMVYLHDEEFVEDRGQLSLLGGALEGLYEMWDELRGFCRDEGVDLRELRVDLDFSRLD